MSLKHLKSPIHGLLMAVLVASFSGLDTVYAAETPAGNNTPPSAAIPTPAAVPVPAATSKSAAGVPGNPDGSCPTSAPVKLSKSRIYHVPEDPNYKNTKAKRCFENAQAAQQAGYRAPKN
ncbi:MAG: hypothetical protein U1F70_08365 [Candidatus Competibacteraceae bacterium]